MSCWDAARNDAARALCLQEVVDVVRSRTLYSSLLVHSLKTFIALNHQHHGRFALALVYVRGFILQQWKTTSSQLCLQPPSMARYNNHFRMSTIRGRRATSVRFDWMSSS